jgi:preprotein translocase subunit SecA
LDTLWMQHLENMQHLREGIHWRSVGQRDPLVEYRQESTRVFDSMENTLRDEVVRAVFHVHRHDVSEDSTDEIFDTELTRAAESSVEQGVNEISNVTYDADFTVKKAKKPTTKNTLAKKRKAERKNKKKARRH